MTEIDEAITEDPGVTRRGSARGRWAVRRRRDRLIAGLASGLADYWDVPAAYVRAGFVVLSLAGGVGIAAYLVGWALTLERGEAPETTQGLLPERKVGLALIYVGALLALRGLGFWPSDELVFGGALLAFGAAALWDRSDPEARNRIVRLTGSGSEEVTRIRVIAGGLLMLAGFTSFVASLDALRDVGPVLLAVAITVIGFMILFGPLVWRMGRDLAEERRARIRSEEREEMAAHLHDSVLQTLALIQRTDDPRRMATLARGQERDLREWLYQQPDAAGRDALAGSIRDQAARIERDHNVPIEVVVVGDAPLTGDLRALVRASGEAMTNAAKHSGAGKVSVYVETTESAVEVYVSDAGSGFDAARTTAAGRGIPDSIIGRMERHGGTTSITSVPGEGTEVHLSMQRS